MFMNILDKINKENDIKNIDTEELPRLAEEIREFLVSHVSETGAVSYTHLTLPTILLV